MLKKLLLILIAILALGLVLLFSVWINLSPDKIEKWTEYQINTQLDSRFVFDIQAVETKLWGVRIDQVTLRDKENALELVNLSQVRVIFNPVSIISARSLPFSADLYGSKLNGVFAFFPQLGISIELNQLEPNLNPYIRKTNVIRSSPTVDLKGRIDSILPLSGKIDLSATRVILTGETQYTKLPIALPETSIDRISLKASLENNNGSLELTTNGDISAAVSGTFRLDGNNIRRTNLNLTVIAEIKDAYLNELGFVKNLIQSYMNRAGKISVKVSGTPTSAKIDKI